MLCCFCLMAIVPISAFALETGETQIIEESTSEQQSFSPELCESNIEMDAQQDTSDEFVVSVIENGTETDRVNELGRYGTAPLEEKNDAIEINPDMPFIRVKKIIQGIPEEKIPAGFYEDFTVNVNNTSNKMSAGTVEEWEHYNLNAGIYTISESGAQIEGYDLSVSVEGIALQDGQTVEDILKEGIQVSLKAADTLVSEIQAGTSQGSGTQYPVMPGTMFVGHNSKDASVIIISHAPIEAGLRQVLEAKLKDLNGWTNKPNFTYYNLSQYSPGDHLKAGSISFTYNGDSITFDAQSNYNKYATTILSVAEAENASITITNTYTPNVRNLTVKKTVSGNMYDDNKEFAFNIAADMPMTFGETTGTEIAFNLKKDGEASISVPVGATVTVSENPDGYTYSFVSITDGVKKTDAENGISFAMPAEDVMVVINNDKTVTVDTGVLLDTLPYVLILGVVAMGAVLLIKKCRNRDDD